MRKATSIISVFLILWVSMHMGIASHFCNSELFQAKIVYGSGEATCGMNCTNTATQTPEKGTIIDMGSCCEDFFTGLSSDEYSPVKNSYSLIEYLNSVANGNNPISPRLSFQGPLPCNHYPLSLTKVSLPFIQVFII